MLALKREMDKKSGIKDKRKEKVVSCIKQKSFESDVRLETEDKENTFKSMNIDAASPIVGSPLIIN
jgi:hypothetical protein